MANHGDKFSVTTNLHPDDSKAVLRILIGDALDRPGEHLPSDGFGPVSMMSVADASSATSAIAKTTALAVACRQSADRETASGDGSSRAHLRADAGGSPETGDRPATFGLQPGRNPLVLASIRGDHGQIYAPI